MTERDRRTDRSQASDTVALTPNMGTEAAMHRNAIHLIVAHLAGVAARNIRYQPRRELPHVAKPSAMSQHLIKRRHAPRRRITPSTRHTRRLELRGIVAFVLAIGVGTAGLLRFRHPNENVVGET